MTVGDIRLGKMFFLFTPAPWMADASCKDSDPDVFFPRKGGSTAIPKEICATCPVREDCLQHAVEFNHRQGVWGGTTPEERKALRREWLRDHRPHPVRLR